MDWCGGDCRKNEDTKCVLKTEDEYQFLVSYLFTNTYYICFKASPGGFYFSKRIFGWGSIRNIPQKVDFLAKKWGFIQENPQKHDFSHYMGLYSRVGLHSRGYGMFQNIYIKIINIKFVKKFGLQENWECCRPSNSQIAKTYFSLIFQLFATILANKIYWNVWMRVLSPGS